MTDEREEFEKIMREMPYERDKWEFYLHQAQGAWPGQYKSYRTQLAFDLFKAGHLSRQKQDAELCRENS